MLVYKIMCEKTGKSYIGITRGSLSHHLATHKYAARSGAMTYLYRAMRKYGIETFKINKLSSAQSIPELRVLEQKLVVEHCTLVPNGYNLTLGGDIGTFSKIVRSKMSAARRMTWKDPVLRSLLSASVKKSWETRQRSTPVEVREKLRISTNRCLKDPEFRKKISDGLKKSWVVRHQRGDDGNYRRVV